MLFRRLLLVVPVLFLFAACNRDPKVASKKYVDIGNKYYGRDKYKEASILYRKALQKDLKNADAYYHLALIDLKQRRIAEAAGALQRCVQLDPSNADATAKLADIYLASYLQNPPKRKADLTEGEALTAQILKRDPKSFDGLRLKAFISLANHDVPEALKNFQAARQIRPNEPDLTLALCQTLYADKQTDQAVSLAKQLIASKKDYGPAYDFLYTAAMRDGKPAEAEVYLKDKIQSNPKNGQDRIELAAHYLRFDARDKMTATLDTLMADSAIPDRYLLAGDFYLRIRQYDASLAAFQKGLATLPAEKATYLKREAQVLVTQGKLQEAAKLIDEVVQANPKDSDGVMMRAALRLRNSSIEDTTGAIKDIQALLERSPNADDLHKIHFTLAGAYLARYETEKATADRSVLQGDLEQARIHFEQAIQIASAKLGIAFSDAKLSLGQVYVYKGDNNRALQLANDVLNNDPNNLQAVMMRSAANVNLRKYDDARADLTMVLKARPEDRNAQYQLAMTNFLDGKYTAADEQFETLMKVGDARGMLGLIDSKNKQHKYEESIRIIETALQKGQNERLFRYMLANTQAQADRYDDAIGNFKKLIAANPKIPDLYVRLAEAYARSGKNDEAIASLNEARKLVPNDTFPILRLASIYEAAGRLDDARQEYEAVLKVQPNNAMALNNLAYMKAESGSDLDQALTLAQRASQQAPDDVNIKDTLAYIYTRKGLNDEGLRILRDIVEKKPDNPSFHYHMALALYQKGDRPSAKKELNSALQNKPTNDQQRRIKELMSKVS